MDHYYIPARTFRDYLSVWFWYLHIKTVFQVCSHLFWNTDYFTLLRTVNFTKEWNLYIFDIFYRKSVLVISDFIFSFHIIFISRDSTTCMLIWENIYGTEFLFDTVSSMAILVNLPMLSSMKCLHNQHVIFTDYQRVIYLLVHHSMYWLSKISCN